MRKTPGFTNAVKATLRERAHGPATPFVFRYLGKNYLLEACDGEAHTNPHIDYCGVCLGVSWGWQARLLSHAVDHYTDWLESQLIPDLKDMGHVATAADFERCIMLMRMLMESGK